MNVDRLAKHLKEGGEIPWDIVDELDIYQYKRNPRRRPARRPVQGGPEALSGATLFLRPAALAAGSNNAGG